MVALHSIYAQEIRCADSIALKAKLKNIMDSVVT